MATCCYKDKNSPFKYACMGLATGDEHSIIMRKFHVFIMCQFIKYIGFKALRIYRNSGNILKKSYCLF